MHEPYPAWIPLIQAPGRASSASPCPDFSRSTVTPLPPLTPPMQAGAADPDHTRIAEDTPVGPVVRLVLDTQVVMEWLVFRDPGIRTLVEPIETGHWHWIGSPAMRDELLHVLSRGVAARWSPDPAGIADVFARLCRMPEPIAEGAALPLLKCRDRDDQKFIDLALAQKVDALISRDSDVLALAKRARKLGLPILRPEQWLQQLPAQAS